jgi:EPS-associated MarR family transcriptional regulator
MNKRGHTLSDSKSINLESEEVIKLLREIKRTPEMTQRELSSSLGISLGKVNFLIKALVLKGFIKANNFKNSNNKAAYFYLLTPRGLEEKTRITYHFLIKKIQEYEKLKEEIQALEKEIESIGMHDD